MRGVVGLATWVGVCLAIGGLGALASANAPEFYARLVKPVWAPPSWLFGPVWTALYLLMGVAAWLVWRERGWRGAPIALSLFVAQLVLNGLWTWIFFAWREGAWALAEIVVLATLIVATVVAFWRVNRTAAGLLLPYLGWVLFATALTAALWRGNRQVL
ncbi:MAG: TspO/MBR family protein [Bryobacteraceae bacterium]|nr:TspO/MBR family protein [Bryobacteraceae bacterium]